MAFSAGSLDSPHDLSNNVNCPSCHFTSDNPPAWYTQPPDPDNPDSASPFNRLCWSCHNDSIAPFEKTHSNFVINGEVGFSKECRACHHAHDQRQIRRWGSASYLYSGASDMVTTTTITKTGAGWTPDQWKNMLVTGNITYPNYNYRILSNTADTLTVEGTINTTYVKAGKTFAITYGKLVKDVVNTKDVKFFRPTDTNSFADGDGTYNGICEVCHTQTTYHRNNASGDHTHNVATKCTLCHDHKEGFKASCNACHGNPPQSDTTGPDGLVRTPSPTGSVKGITHVRHATGGSNYSFVCDTCHSSGMPVTPIPDYKTQIGFNIFGWPGAGTTYKGQTLLAPYSYEYTNGTTEGTTTFQCSNIYCHGRKPDGTVWGAGNNTNPLWNGTVVCGDCHKATNADNPTVGSHSKHTEGIGYNYSCGLCHKDPNTDRSAHVNNKSEVVFSSNWRTSGGSYSGTDTMLDAYGQCTNIYCHSTVQTSPPGGTPIYRTTPTWGENNSLWCQDCHYDSESDPDLVTGSHRKHFEYYPDNETSCALCHNNNQIDDACFACHDVPGGTWIPDKHANGSINVAFYPFMSGTNSGYSGTLAPGDAYGRCQNIYCHSNGTAVSTGVITANTTPFWGSSGPLACTACHAYPPDYASGSPKANSHSIHIAHLGGYSNYCSFCHYTTTTTGTTITNKSNHVNSVYDVAPNTQDCNTVFNSGNACNFVYTYAADGGTCATNDCHGDAKWGTGSGGGGGTDCTTCHGHEDDWPVVPGFTWHGTKQSHSTHTENDANDLKGPYLQCSDCHDTNNFPRFKDGQDKAGTTVCDTCHSPGGTYDGVNDPAIGAKANWATGVYNSDKVTLQAGKEKWCATCHDEAPSAISGVGAPNVVGDEDATTAYGVGYGFYKSGHGLPSDQVYQWTSKTGSPQQRAGAGLSCSACHDYSARHVDGLARTYESPGDSAEYQAGYRLKSIGGQSPLVVPRTYEFDDPVDVHPEDFRLCLSCHNPYPFTANEGVTLTNFRNVATNAHYYHLSIRDTYGPGPAWQSDWNQPPTGQGDSRAQCVQCHNVHGSTRLAMVTDGKLTSREPGIRVLYTNNYPNVPSGLTLPDSNASAWIPDDFGPSKPNSTCTQTCHGGPGGAYSSYYSRTPYENIPPSIIGAFGKVGGDRVIVRFSEGVYTSTGASAPLETGDFALTDLDNVRTISGISHTASYDFAVLTLSSPLDALNDLGTDTVAAATSSSIYDGPGNAMNTSAVVISGNDITAPSISALSPPDGSSNVRMNSNLSFILSDSESGVDWTTFSIQLTGNNGYSASYAYSSGRVSATDYNPAEISVTVDPEVDFGDNEVITVAIAVMDFSGNPLPPVSWSFSASSVPVPDAPVMETPTVVSTSAITWYFTDQADNETGFRLHDGSDLPIMEQPGADLSFFDETGLNADTLYTRHVHAYNASGNSIASSNVSIATFSDPPAGASASDGAYEDKIALSWVSGGAQSGYRVFRGGDQYTGVQVYDGTDTGFDDPVTGNYAYYVYSKNRQGVLSDGYATDTGYTDGEQTLTLHASGLNTANSWTASGGAWDAILDSNDGDGTYANHGTGSGTDAFWVNTDDLPSCTSVTSIRVSAYIRATDGSGFGNPYSSDAYFDVGYYTGAGTPSVANTKWKGSTQIPGNTPGYTLIQSVVYTVDSSNGALDCSDIQNLKLAVRRLTTGAHQDRVTEVYAEVTYVP